MANLDFQQIIDLRLLMSVDGIGVGRTKNLLAKFHSTEHVLSANIKDLMEVEGLSINLAQRIHRCNDHRNEIEDIRK